MHPYLDDDLFALSVIAMCGLVFTYLVEDPAIEKVGIALFTAASVMFIFVGFARLVLWLTGT